MSNVGKHMRPMTPRATHWAGISLVTLALAFGWATSSRAEEPVPFAISVDGEAVDGSSLPSAKPQQRKDGLDIQVKSDAIGFAPALNVSTVPPRASYRVGDEIKFLASYNYGAWIERAELRIFKRGRLDQADLVATLPLENKLATTWKLPEGMPSEMLYLLRVYDAKGRYDETLPLPLAVTATERATHDNGEKSVAPGYAEDRTAFRNILINGGTVTVYGNNVPEGYDVLVEGEPAPVDDKGSFVVQRLLPSGKHKLDVAVTKGEEGLHFSRDVDIPEDDWFYVGMADFVAEHLLDKVERINPGEFGNDPKTRGRLAFYLKGKIKGRYILTASADTKESGLSSIFSNLDGKDPRAFLNRIDPDDYYPVYGDDSTSTEDAPTRGKFYVKLQSGPSHVMWGNFKSKITGSHFLRNERALYGAQGVYHSNTVAPDGTPKSTVTAHGAIPGTLPHRDTMRGTGGSAYFLKHQDITPGTESVSIEVRNPVTGWVTSSRSLKYGTDYDFDYVQGVIILREPLNSTGSNSAQNFLISSYEYSPSAADVKGYAFGGRVQQWIDKNIRLGVTGSKESTGLKDQRLVGADIRLRGRSDDTYVDLEVARSQGPGFNSAYSADGGLTLQDNTSTGSIDRAANAFRAEASTSLAEVTGGKLRGSVGTRFEHYDEGFSSYDTNADVSRRLWGVESDLEISDKGKVAASYSDELTGDGRKERQALGKIRQKISDKNSIEPYGRFTLKRLGSTATTGTEQGKRGDVGLRLYHTLDEDREVSVFGETTVARTGTMLRDDRLGLGGKFRLTEKVKLESEASYGTQGPGAAITLAYEPTVDDRYYIGYQLDPTRDVADNWPFALVGQDMGTVVTGARRRISDRWLAYGEENVDIFGKRKSLTQTYGVTFTPDPAWEYTGGVEVGNVYDRTTNPDSGLKNPDYQRTAFSAGVAYKPEGGIDGRLRGEYRIDDSDDDSRDVTNYLVKSSLGLNMNDDWRALASLDAVVTDATESTRKGEYMEASLGFAYRPVASDRLNTLAKYTYLYDMPGDDQVSIDGSTSSPSQQSHIVSYDVNYDLTPKLTLGAKYGARVGEIRERVSGASWEKSVAHLAILRSDFHLVHKLDAMLEGRALWSPTSNSTDLGAVAAVYRHIGDNFKAGVGYNFGSFSDDLRDVTHNDHGVFVNLIGKF